LLPNGGAAFFQKQRSFVFRSEPDPMEGEDIPSIIAIGVSKGLAQLLLAAHGIVP
jgi:hypothetical protein